MREISEVQEIQAIALDILEYIDRICRENQLHYFMSDGTLLGAVRHKGYIPWDDDVDIWMPREDYKKIEEIINQDSNAHYRLINRQNTRGYIYGFGKVIDTRTLLIENIEKKCKMGIYVDIFPYDGLPGKCKEDYEKHVKTCLFWDRQRYPAFCSYKTVCRNYTTGNRRRFFTWIIRKCIGGKNILRLMDKLSQKYPVEGAEFVGCLTSGYKAKDMMPAWVCAETVDMAFEDKVFQAPKGYETFLEIEYGDYMKLPPKEKQVSHHDFKAWWKEDER